MAYKIRWMTGGETAERYSTKGIANKVLKKTNLSGTIVKTNLGKAGRTAPFKSVKSGGEKKSYPSGAKLVWKKTSDGIYRKSIVR